MAPGTSLKRTFPSSYSIVAIDDGVCGRRPQERDVARDLGEGRVARDFLRGSVTGRIMGIWRPNHFLKFYYVTKLKGKYFNHGNGLGGYTNS